jgi:hypothetical protein
LDSDKENDENSVNIYAASKEAEKMKRCASGRTAETLVSALRSMSLSAVPVKVMSLSLSL